VVPVPDHRLARAQPDAHAQPLLRAAVAALEQLLGEHRAPDRRRRRAERHHQAVAGALDLVAARGADRIA
jgi:hypothetical protein